MRLSKVVPVVLALPIVLGGCGTTSGAEPSATPSPGSTWLRVATGSVPASPAIPAGGKAPSGLPWRSLPPAPPCAIAWPTDQQVLIPMIVTPGRRSITVQWPARYGPDYRLAAIDQRLVSGTQPAPTWITAKAGTGCTVTATLTGLKSGNPYVVWLDAPNTPRDIDGSRSLYSGRSAVVKPR